MTSRLLRGAALRQPPPPGTVLFHDDFDGPAGDLPNPEFWTPDIGRGTFTMADGRVVYGWGNDEFQYYTADSLALDGASNLVLTCRRATPPDGADVDADHHFVSGRIRSQFKRHFVPPVRIEARIKWPAVAGLSIAWWTMGGPDVYWPHLGEIDMFEVFLLSGEVRATAAAASIQPNPDDFTVSTPANFAIHDDVMPGGIALDADYIIHRTDLLPDSITTYVNGTQWLQSTKAEFLDQGWAWPYDRTSQYLLFAFAIQYQPDPAFTEAEVLIDYVTVTQL